MVIPAAVAAYGWIPFAVVLLLILIFSVAFVRYYQSYAEYEIVASIVAVISLTLTLTTSALLPIDVFLVSWMKTPNGTFQEWAANATDRKTVEDGVMFTYYGLYGSITFLAFAVIPFAYFYYEERDDDRPWRPRALHALKFSFGFAFLAAVILLMGAFIPLNSDPNFNGTAWDQLENLFKSVEKNGGEDAISFMVSILCLVGIAFNMFYTGYGMGSWPVSLLKGTRSARRDYEDIVTRRSEIRRQYEGSNSRGYASARSRELAETERLLVNQEQELEGPARSRFRACLGTAWRPLEFLLGFVLLLLAGLIFISLLLTNVDKAMHGYMRMAYLVPYSNRTLTNPLDWILVKAQHIFPMDFIIYACIVIFLALCTIMAVRTLGIRCLCVKLFKIRYHGTRPQGILFLCFILTFAILGLNVICYFLSPQYSTFGNEHYVAYMQATGHDYSAVAMVKPCEEGAVNDCIMTRNSFFLVRYFFKAWFFGACYFWLSWGVLAMYLIGLIHALVKRRRTAADEVEDDLDELE